MSSSPSKKITSGTKLTSTIAGIALSLLIGNTLWETFVLLWRAILFPPIIPIFPALPTIIVIILPCIIVGVFVWLVYWFYICRFVGCAAFDSRCFPIWACRWVKIYVPILVIWCVIVRIILVAVYPPFFAWMFVP